MNFGSLFEIAVAFADEVTVAAPVSTPATGDLTDIIHQAYNAAMMFGGLLAFLMILYAGAQYVFDPANPSSKSNAKDQIWQAFLGLLLLFGIYLVLNTINPELTKLQIPTLKKVTVPRDLPVELIQASTSTGRNGIGGPNTACGAFCPTGKRCNAETRQCEWQKAANSTCDPNAFAPCGAGETCRASGDPATPTWSCVPLGEGETISAACGTACPAQSVCSQLRGFAPTCMRRAEDYNCRNCVIGQVCVEGPFGYYCATPAR